MLRNRYTHSALIAATIAGASAIGLGTYFRGSRILMEPDAGDAGGGGGGGGSGGSGSGEGGGGGAGAGAGGGGGNADVISRTEFTKVVTQRDRAKADAKAQRVILAKVLGVDAEELKIVETGDPEDPYKVEGPGVDDALKLIQQARAAQPPTSKKWEDRERELLEAHRRKLDEVKSHSTRTVQQLERHIRSIEVVQPIRIAASAEGAIDPMEGTAKAGEFNDLVALLSSRIKTDLEFDEETKEFKGVTVTVLREDGESPLLTASGQRATVRDLVAEFLKSRPHFRKTNVRSGPGAGGHGGGKGGNGEAIKNNVKTSVGAMFGRKPS